VSNVPGGARRETFASRFGLLASMIGVAVGLGNVWRFPYMVGSFGGAPFVIFYVSVVLLIGIPALMAEWTLGRHTGRGPVGAFARAGLWQGARIGWFLFAVVVLATAYYTCAIGWVLYHGIAYLISSVGIVIDASKILPPQRGFDPRSVGLQVVMNAVLLGACVLVVAKGLRRGIERVSSVIIPALFVILLVLVIRSLTLDGAWEGVRWYALKFDPSALTPEVMLAATGQAFFSLSLGGTFMVVYGSYLGSRDRLLANSGLTALGDLTVGLLAGLAIIPAVFALGLRPDVGPDLIFVTLPSVFAKIPVGWLFATLFFVGLAGAAYLSNVANLEVLVAGLVDTGKLRRGPAAVLMASVILLLSLVPMLNLDVFMAWDLTFGSGMQILGSFVAVVTVAWVVKRSEALRQLGLEEGRGSHLLLYYWLRFVIPGAILAMGAHWVVTDVLGRS